MAGFPPGQVLNFMRQLPLGVRLNDSAVFETYSPGPNEGGRFLSLSEWRSGGADSGAWMWGISGSGKTHLLQAACRAAELAARSAGYLPMDRLAKHGPGVLEGWHDRDLVALDSVESVAGNPRSSRPPLFKLFNDLQASGGRLLIATQCSTWEPADKARRFEIKAGLGRRYLSA